MKLKRGVILAGLDIRMRPVLKAADRIWRSHGRELVVTGGLEGTHSAGSFHYYGLAVDLRTRYFPASLVPEIAQQLRDALGIRYDVVQEPNHIHIEYDHQEITARHG